MIKTPNDTLRCHPLHGSTSPGITGTGITGAEITKASSRGVFGVASSGSPSHIEATASGISLDQLHLGSPEHQLDQQHHMGPLESLDHRHLGPPDHQLSRGSTDRQCPLHPGSHQLLLSQTLEPSSTTKQTVSGGGSHTLMTTEGQPRANPDTRSAKLTQDDQEPPATSPAFVYTRKPT